MSYSYKFENPRFDIRVIEIDLNSNGTGELRFTRGASDEVLDCKVKLLPATIARISSLFEASDFLGSNTEYQDKKDFAHLGWVTLGARQGTRERKTRFNFTTNIQIKALEEIFRASPRRRYRCLTSRMPSAINPSICQSSLRFSRTILGSSG